MFQDRSFTVPAITQGIITVPDIMLQGIIGGRTDTATTRVHIGAIVTGVIAIGGMIDPSGSI